MSVKTRKRPVAVRAALERFIELVRTIPEVKHVALPEGGHPEVFTYIASRDEDVCYRVIRAEDAVLRELPETEIEFHVRFLDGRPTGPIAREPGIHIELSQDG